MSVRREITVAVETTGQAYLELLRSRGFDYFFGNAGTDFGPLVDAFARFEAEGKDRPRPITVPHEFVAVGMAHGVTMCTGRPQVVMVHTIVGTANCAGALINAARANIPLFMTAGRTPLVESGLLGARDRHIHWAQEAYEKIVEAHGGYGERVERPDQVRPALQRALRAVREEKRQAVLNVICKPD